VVYQEWTIHPWRWRCYLPSKRRPQLTQRCCVTPQKITLLFRISVISVSVSFLTRSPNHISRVWSVTTLTLHQNYPFARDDCSYKQTPKHRLYKISYQAPDHTQLAVTRKYVFNAINIRHEPYPFYAIILLFLPPAALSVLVHQPCVMHLFRTPKINLKQLSTLRVLSGWSEVVCPKHWYLSTKLHGVIYQNTIIVMSYIHKYRTSTYGFYHQCHFLFRLWYGLITSTVLQL
jgi:hypothetical protein